MRARVDRISGGNAFHIPRCPALYRQDTTYAWSLAFEWFPSPGGGNALRDSGYPALYRQDTTYAWRLALE